MFLTTYINAVDPLARVYDGFLVHSRFGPAAPLDGSSIFDELQSAARLASGGERSVRTCASRCSRSSPKRTSSVACRLGYYFARQPDNEWLRVWEIPGAAHADNYTIQVAPIDTGSAPIDDIVAAYEPTNMLMGQQLGHYINFAPQHHYVVQAALAALTNWVGTGEPAPAAPRPSRCAKPKRHNRFWIATAWPRAASGRLGWTSRSRGPPVSSPRRTPQKASWPRSSAPANRSTPPLLRRLYPGGLTEYLESFTVALDSAIESGFILPADRAEILELAAATYPYS